MTIPALPIGFSDVKAEFGGLQLTPLSAYVRGGAYVPIQTLGDIATAPPLELSSFAGVSYPAALTFDTLTTTDGYAFAPPTIAPDLSTMIVAASRSRVVNGGTSWTDITGFNLRFDVTGGDSVVVRLPASQPRDVNGYWQLASGGGLFKSTAPAQFNPTLNYTLYDQRWRVYDELSAYQGGVIVNTPVLPGNGAAPPQSGALSVVAGKFNLFVTVRWELSVGTAIPPYSSMTFDTHNVSNTYVEFPLILDVYNGALLVASYETLLRVELDCDTTFNPS